MSWGRAWGWVLGPVLGVGVLGFFLLSDLSKVLVAKFKTIATPHAGPPDTNRGNGCWRGGSVVCVGGSLTFYLSFSWTNGGGVRREVRCRQQEITELPCQTTNLKPEPVNF